MCQSPPRYCADSSQQAVDVATGQIFQASDAAFYDPDVATALSNVLEFDKTTPKPINRLYTFLIFNGIVAETREQERQQNQP